MYNNCFLALEGYENIIDKANSVCCVGLCCVELCPYWCFDIIQRESALMIACKNQSISIAVMLIAAGAKVLMFFPLLTFTPVHDNNKSWCHWSGRRGSCDNVEKRRRQDHLAQCCGWIQLQFHLEIIVSGQLWGVVFNQSKFYLNVMCWSLVILILIFMQCCVHFWLFGLKLPFYYSHFFSLWTLLMNILCFWIQTNDFSHWILFCAIARCVVRLLVWNTSKHLLSFICCCFFFLHIQSQSFSSHILLWCVWLLFSIFGEVWIWSQHVDGKSETWKGMRGGDNKFVQPFLIF